MCRRDPSLAILLSMKTIVKPPTTNRQAPRLTMADSWNHTKTRDIDSR